MESTLPRPLIEIKYYEAAQRYLRSLPPEHFMEAMPQGTQRKITLCSLELVSAQRPDVRVFNEMLVQYPREEDEVGQVVPDNMVVISKTPLEVDGSFDLELQPEAPFWVLEYVSRNSKRKDYVDNREKYERDLKVPYFLLFYPERQDLTLFHHDGSRYCGVVSNEHGRLAIPELELEVALHEEWLRFWFRGELLPLPGELLFERDEANRRAEAEAQRAEAETRRADAEAQRANAETERSDALEREVQALHAILKKQGDAPLNGGRG
jgi:Uma2 family endonuclease